MSWTGGENLDDHEFDQARAWGANVVRVTLNEDYWNQQCPTSWYDPGYRYRVDSIVDWVTSRGMVALLELTTNPRFVCDTQAQSRQRMPDYPGSVIFWGNVAARYKDNPLVAFGLYNEPHDVNEDVWSHGGTITEFPVTWAAAGMQQLYNAIRGVGAQNLVFASGLDWGARAPSVVLSGTNVAYSEHVYTCPNYPPPKCIQPHTVGPFGLLWVNSPVANPYDPTPLMNSWDPLAGSQPVVISEFGWPSSDDGTYNANVISAAEARGRGWIAYAWNGTTTGTFNLLDTVGPTVDYTPSPSGAPVKAGLSVNP
jgi:hypothetical protein